VQETAAATLRANDGNIYATMVRCHSDLRPVGSNQIGATGSLHFGAPQAPRSHTVSLPSINDEDESSFSSPDAPVEGSSRRGTGGPYGGYNRDAVDSFVSRYTAAMEVYTEMDHPDPHGKLLVAVRDFLENEIGGYLSGRTMQSPEQQIVQHYAESVVATYRQSYDMRRLFHDNIDLLRRLTGNAAHNALTDFSTTLLPNALSTDLALVQNAYHADRQADLPPGLEPLVARRASSDLTLRSSSNPLHNTDSAIHRSQTAEAEAHVVDPTRSQSAGVVGTKKKSKKRPMMRRRNHSAGEVKSRAVPRPTISPEGFITLSTEGYEVEARYVDPASLYTTGVQVGEGGFGKVCKVIALGSQGIKGQELVMKSSDSKIGEPGKDEVREIWTMSRTGHRNLVQLKEALLWEATEDRYKGSHFSLYLVMTAVCPPPTWEIQAPSLTDHIVPGNNPLPPIVAALICKQVADGLKFLNDKLLTVHRDLKADNVLVGRGGFHDIRLCDYGTCIALDKQADGSIAKDLPAYVGTTTYRAPELWDAVLQRGHRATVETTPKVDVWSLGCVLYFILAQMPLYREDQIEKRDGKPVVYYDRIRAGEVDLFDSRMSAWAQSDPGCIRFLMAMLQADPAERYTVEDVLADPWLNQQLDLLHHCQNQADVDTRLFSVQVDKAVERSDDTGDLVPSPISESLRWLRESPQALEWRDEKYMEKVGFQGHGRTEKTRADASRLLDLKTCFDLDHRYRIPEGEKCEVVVKIMQVFLNRITDEAGKSVTLLYHCFNAVLTPF